MLFISREVAWAGLLHEGVQTLRCSTPGDAIYVDYNRSHLLELDGEAPSLSSRQMHVPKQDVVLFLTK